MVKVLAVKGLLFKKPLVGLGKAQGLRVWAKPEVFITPQA